MPRSAWLLFLVACGVPADLPRDRYADVAADVYCQRLRECARGQFERAHFGARDCRAGAAMDFELIARAAEADDCGYREAAAGEAVRELRTMSCADFYEEAYVEAFDALWDCSGE